MEELLKIATVTNKLILFGNSPLNLPQNEINNFSRVSPFFWLGENLFPNYCYQFKNQFRLHFSLSKPIFTTLYNQWIHTEINPQSLPINETRLQWIDVRGKPQEGVNILEGKRLLKFLSQLQNFSLDDIGILAFTNPQSNWLKNNILPQFQEIFIGNISDWIGKEKKIMLISLVGENIHNDQIAIVLTRVKDYLILFGDYQLWLKKPSYLRDLILSEYMEREREITLV